MDTKIYFYNLSDPETDEVCYIGQTVNPSQRLLQHLTQLNGTYYKNLWIGDLRQRGLLPVMTVIQERNSDDIDHWWHERKLIKFYWNSGQPLLNGGIRDKMCKAIDWIHRLDRAEFNLLRKVFVKQDGKSLVVRMY